MNVGWIGLGKLGLPCALTLEHNAGVNIIGYDVNPVLKHPNEEHLDELLLTTHMVMMESIKGVVANCDGVIFTAVQTPHKPEYGGDRPMPDETADFDYTYLRRVAEDVNEAAEDLGVHVTLVIISTALPGTMRREIMPLLGDYVEVVYNPFFIAMGTTVEDFLNPEFVLLGSDNHSSAGMRQVTDLYERMYGRGKAPFVRVGIEEAELIKVAYNTFISMKIVYTNTLMEICHKMGMDVDSVTDGLKQATRRVVSPAYMTAGMGDGGACHPRDNIAMSWLADQLGLSADPFRFVSKARENQSNWLAFLVWKHANARSLPVVLMGRAYKPESDLTFGSPSDLLAYELKQWNVPLSQYDPIVDPDQIEPDIPAVYVIATKHEMFRNWKFPEGSVVVDPFRYVSPQKGVTHVPVGGIVTTNRSDH